MTLNLLFLIVMTESDEPDDDGVSCLWDLHLHGNKYLKSTKWKCPCIEFSPLHPENLTHYQKVRTRERRLIPVPIGCSLPRQDHDDTKERHA